MFTVLGAPGEPEARVGGVGHTKAVLHVPGGLMPHHLQVVGANVRQVYHGTRVGCHHTTKSLLVTVLDDLHRVPHSHQLQQILHIKHTVCHIYFYLL